MPHPAINQHHLRLQAITQTRRRVTGVKDDEEGRHAESARNVFTFPHSQNTRSSTHADTILKSHAHVACRKTRNGTKWQKSAISRRFLAGGISVYQFWAESKKHFTRGLHAAPTRVQRLLYGRHDYPPHPLWCRGNKTLESLSSVEMMFCVLKHRGK